MLNETLKKISARARVIVVNRVRERNDPPIAITYLTPEGDEVHETAHGVIVNGPSVLKYDGTQSPAVWLETLAEVDTFTEIED